MQTMGSGLSQKSSWGVEGGEGEHAAGRVNLPVVEVGARESYAKLASALTFAPELD